jgi:uncharacterized protein YggU (UPF0235/DUF167 family)
MQELKINGKKKYQDELYRNVREAAIVGRANKALIIMHAKAIAERKKGIVPKVYLEKKSVF